MKTKKTELDTRVLKEVRNGLVKLDLSLRSLISTLETILLLDIDVEDEKQELEKIPKKEVKSSVEPEIIVPKDSVRKIDIARYLRNRKGKLEIVKIDKEGNKYILHKRDNPKLAHILPERLDLNQMVEIATSKQVYKGTIRSITNKDVNKDFFFVLDNGTEKHPWVQLSSIEKIDVIDDNKRTNTKSSKGITHKT